jgi:uncharacterized membrane protein YeiH
MLLLPFWLDAAGVFVFAVSGAITASRKQLDIVGFVFVATVTGIGGGTVRDLVLGRDPVFWIAAPEYLYVTTAAAVLVYFTAHLVERRYTVLLWADAIGLALFCVLGARIALLTGTGPVVAVLMGVMTATMGGLIRDVVCNEQPLILAREIYATAAALGAGVTVGMLALDLPAIAAEAAGIAAALIARGAAIQFGISIPVYKARPGRPPPER